MNETIQPVDQAIRSRHSMRNFLDKPVPQALVRELLELAACAPSSTNVQPWKVYALCGADKAALSAAVMARFEQGETDGREVDCYPKEWQELWLSRRRAVGLGLYKLLGIGKEDKARMKAQHARNFTFFDAPVGLLLTIDRRLGQGMLIDCGLFLGNLTIAARARGLDTCIQAFFADYHKTIRSTVGISDNEIVLVGVSLGYANPDAPENKLISEREAVEGFAEFRGFADK